MTTPRLSLGSQDSARFIRVKEKSFVACRGGLCRISILAGFAREILHSRWSRPRRDSQTTLVVQDRQPLPAVWLTIGAVVDKARFCTRHAEFSAVAVVIRS